MRRGSKIYCNGEGARNEGRGVRYKCGDVRDEGVGVRYEGRRVSDEEGEESEQAGGTDWGAAGQQEAGGEGVGRGREVAERKGPMRI